MGRYSGIATITVKRSMAKVGKPTQPVRVRVWHTMYTATMLFVRLSEHQTKHHIVDQRDKKYTPEFIII